MKIVDFIINEIDKRGMTQQKAAELCGMTRQALWDTLDKHNPRFNTVERILRSLGMVIVLYDRSSGDRKPEWMQTEWMSRCERTNLTFDAIVEILEALDVGVYVGMPENSPWK